jgi:holo-[acyl-carrier protein] synthase
MRIIGHGIDAVKVARIKRLLESPRRRWAEKFCSEAERKLAGEPPKHVRFYAGRYAAKEAVAKALGTGFAGEVTWHNIEILQIESGAPLVRLSNGALLYAASLGINRWFLSISHCGEIAFASAIAAADLEPEPSEAYPPLGLI